MTLARGSIVADGDLRGPDTLPETPLDGLFDSLWDWTSGLDPGQSAAFPTRQGSVLHAERAGGALRLTLVGGHRSVVYRWEGRGEAPLLVAPFGLPASTDAPRVRRGSHHHVVELRPGGALFEAQVPFP